MENHNPRLNASGLPDPTAYEAIKEVSAEEARVHDVIKTVKNMLRLSDCTLLNRIELRDNRTGRVYK